MPGKDLEQIILYSCPADPVKYQALRAGALPKLSTNGFGNKPKKNFSFQLIYGKYLSFLLSTKGNCFVNQLIISRSKVLFARYCHPDLSRPT